MLGDIIRLILFIVSSFLIGFGVVLFVSNVFQRFRGNVKSFFDWEILTILFVGILNMYLIV